MVEIQAPDGTWAPEIQETREPEAVPLSDQFAQAVAARPYAAQPAPAPAPKAGGGLGDRLKALEEQLGYDATGQPIAQRVKELELAVLGEQTAGNYVVIV